MTNNPPFVLQQFSDKQMDLLKEVGNIGSGHAATALSTLLNRKIEMKVPNVEFVTFEEMFDLAGGAENKIVGLFLRVDGEAAGNMFCLLSVDQAQIIAKEMLQQQGFPFEGLHHEMSKSLLQELGNILSGSYLAAIADLTNLSLYPTVPSISIDMAGAIISHGLLELSTASDVAIVVNTSLHEVDETSSIFNGDIILLLDSSSFSQLFQALDVRGKCETC
ncbi:chemotaxis protein CheC [Cytobacillus purgationiresistens]|uniref:Chemotaxis protein CheC n=1 Tax=Cytobacillus purgationiresistens TaxID=863449 RepID=A0ABU0AG20_9BACI|nr:chemotaxis protein CheC [Cytobacillus purgationiresistens]MDQ0270206.1 chemotaxis protein CheC [Cytobacillus purgationiresistens]